MLPVGLGKLGGFFNFRDRFKSWFTSSSIVEVMTQTQFDFVVIGWVGCVHSCTEIKLLPLWIVAQWLWQIGSFFDFLR